jgi:hypothetical protein
MSTGDLHEQLKHRALDYVNLVREFLELDPIGELRPGLRNSAHECPVARSIKDGEVMYVLVTPDECYIHGEHSVLRPSGAVSEFIRAVDRGEYPELTL